MLSKIFKRAALGLAAIALAAAAPALAQTTPTGPGTQTYTPAAILPPTTLTAAGLVPFQVNTNGGNLNFRLSGTNTAVVGKFECSDQRAGTPIWQQVSVQPQANGAAIVRIIAGNGLYRLNAAGFAQCRFNLTSIGSGSLVVSAASSNNATDVATLPRSRATYSFASLIGTGATNHFLVITGSATTVVRVTHLECSGLATTAVNLTITAEIDSAADTGDAGTALTATPNDSTNVVATAVVLKHTTSPTPGALVGLVAAGGLFLGQGATIQGNKVSWDFGTRPGEQDMILRGVAQSLSLNSNAAFGAGASVGCQVVLTEE